jgi:hypothetical protein
MSPAHPLSQDLDDYDGVWVAVRDGLVVTSAVDEQTLRRDPAVHEGDLLFPIGAPAAGFYMINV